MQYTLIVTSQETQTAYDLSELVTEITYTTYRTGSAGTLKFTIIDDIPFTVGNAILLTVAGVNVFYGYVFGRSVDRWGAVTVTAYDQLRYLKAKASYAFYNSSVGDIIKQIAADFQLSAGSLADTGYLFPSFIQNNKTCLDIISEALQQTLLATGNMYYLYDNAGLLTLAPITPSPTTIVIGNGSLLGDYTFNTDIDTQTYNQIKLVKQNKETGTADTYVYFDSETQKQWGLLQYYDVVDESLNAAQIAAQGQQMLEAYNRPYVTFKADALGVVGIRAGQLIMLDIPERNISQLVLLERVTHTFKQNYHTMSFDTLPL